MKRENLDSCENLLEKYLTYVVALAVVFDLWAVLAVVLT